MLGGGGGGSRAVTRQEMEFESFSKSLPEDSEIDELPSDEGTSISLMKLPGGGAVCTDFNIFIILIENPSAAVTKEEEEFQAKTRSIEQEENEPEIEIENASANNQDHATTGSEDECQTQFDRAGDDTIYDQVPSDDYIEASDSNESVNEEERDNDHTVAGNAVDPSGDPEDNVSDTLLSIDKSLEDIRKSLDDIQGALNDDD